MGSILRFDTTMVEILRSDDRGRITIPEWAREKLGHKPGQALELRVEDAKIILSLPSNEDGKRLDEILEKVKFDRAARRRAEQWLKQKST